MIPDAGQIARQLAILNEMHPKQSIKQLAGRLGFSPIYIINALDEGERMGLFTRNKKNSSIKNHQIELNYQDLDLGDDITQILMAIERVIGDANDDEQDVESKTLEFWCVGINPAITEMCIYILKEANIIAEYELSDPKDEKSKYTFYSLYGNEQNKWGKKQFKGGSKSDRKHNRG